ncbi:uncharacterized protein N7506_005009 [Penicillium brevicompactum]|uniref:uncharacterized protein n=1 Tax=Penicillium brevicompactum TaxID=5074 RepID=UPI0025401D61|nr:uncharacterized protein N7506_005009 [Penicillium brevicompactum]KAJ5336987.1 hypothetical protein N7506_005009 [Penicillium brevicompactum]
MSRLSAPSLPAAAANRRLVNLANEEPSMEMADDDVTSNERPMDTHIHANNDQATSKNKDKKGTTEESPEEENTTKKVAKAVLLASIDMLDIQLANITAISEMASIHDQITQDERLLSTVQTGRITSSYKGFFGLGESYLSSNFPRPSPRTNPPGQ